MRLVFLLLIGVLVYSISLLYLPAVLVFIYNKENITYIINFLTQFLMKKIYALFMTLCLVLSATAAPLIGTVKESYPLNTKEVVSTAKLSLGTMQKAPAATQGMQYDATEGELIRYYNESDALNVDATYLADGQLSIKMIASDASDMLSLVLWVQDTVAGTIIPEGTYPITSEPAYGTAYASPGIQNGSVYPSFYGMLNSKGQILTPLYFLESGNVVVEVVDGNVKISIDAANSNNVPMTIVYEVGGKSEKVEVKGPLKYDATEADGALDVTYGADATVQLSNGNGYSILTVASPDATNEVDLAFFYDAADPETVIPAGTYTIDDSYTSGTVLASSGVNSQGQVSLSFYANLNASGQLVTPIYFLVSGTVEVTNVDGQLKVEVNAVNSNNVPIHIVYDATPAEPEYEITPVTMTNLSVSEMGGGMVFLSADDAQNTGLYVMLLLNGDGSLNLEQSYVAIMRGWEETVLTLVEGSITKTYSEELATDVYSGLIVVENEGTLMGIELTMYYEVPEPIIVVVENATIEDDTENSGFMYMNGEWTNAEGVVYPVSVEVPGYDATATEAVYNYASVTIGSWSDENGVLAYVQGDLTATVADGVLTLTGVLSGWDGTVVNLTISGILPVVEEPVEIVGVVKRTLFNGYDVVVLTHEEDGTAHIYNIVEGDVLEVSQEGVIAVDPMNAGDMLAISDIALTEDGKLVAINKIVCQAGDAQVDEGYKRGETRVYIWNDLAGAPSIWFTSKMSSNWYRSVQGHTMAYKGTSTNGTLFTTGITASGNKFRYSVYNVIDGVYTDPAVNDSEYYHYTKGDAQTTDLLGANYELNVSPLAENTWVLDGNLVDPFEITDPLTYNTEVTAGATVNEDLGKKFNGASYVTVGEQVLMVAPFATPAGALVGVEILDITNGLGAAQYVDMLYLEESVEVTAAATAVTVVENTLVVALVADAEYYMLELKLGEDEDIAYTTVEISNLVVTPYGAYDLLEGDDNYTGISVVLGVDAEGNLIEGSEVTWYGSSLPIMRSTTITKFYSEELATDVYTGKVVVEFYGEPMGLDLTMYNGGGSNEVIDVIITDATFTVDTYPDGMGGTYDVVDMVAQWGDGELSAMGLDLEFEGFMMISYETEDDFFSWMSYSATVTTENNVVTIAGEFECMYTGNTYNVNISGQLPGDGSGVENVHVEATSVKMIKNGQLIIIKNGVQYNVNGAILK